MAQSQVVLNHYVFVDKYHHDYFHLTIPIVFSLQSDEYF